jgi:hypothetical protein
MILQAADELHGALSEVGVDLGFELGIGLLRAGIELLAEGELGLAVGGFLGRAVGEGASCREGELAVVVGDFFGGGGDLAFELGGVEFAHFPADDFLESRSIRIVGGRWVDAEEGADVLLACLDGAVDAEVEIGFLQLEEFGEFGGEFGERFGDGDSEKKDYSSSRRARNSRWMKSFSRPIFSSRRRPESASAFR